MFLSFTVKPNIKCAVPFLYFPENSSITSYFSEAPPYRFPLSSKFHKYLIIKCNFCFVGSAAFLILKHQIILLFKWSRKGIHFQQWPCNSILQFKISFCSTCIIFPESIVWYYFYNRRFYWLNPCNSTNHSNINMQRFLLQPLHFSHWTHSVLLCWDLSILRCMYNG